MTAPMPAAGAVFALGNGWKLGGTTIWFLHLARHLAREGRPVTLIEHARGGAFRPLEEQPDPAVRRLPCPQRWDAPVSARLIRRRALPVYTQALPAIFLPSDALGPFAACALLSRQAAARMRLISVGHGESDPYNRWLTYYEPIAHFLVAVNSTQAERLRAALPDRAADILLRPCPVEVPATLARGYAPPGAPLTLIYAGRLADGDKGVSALVPLADALVRRGANFRLRILGEGPYRACLERDLARASEEVRRRIALEPPVPPAAMPGIWRAADVVVLVSRQESTGLAMLEGMAQGCVPVATRCNGPRDVIEHGRNGYLAELGDVAGMAAAVAELDTRRERLAEVGARAWQTALERFSFKDYGPWFAALLDEAWRRPARPWPADRPLIPFELRTRSWVRRSAGALWRAVRRRLAPACGGA